MARTSSMHLTLSFIGKTTEEKVQKLIWAMEATASTCTPFTLSAGGVGVFPSIKNARVIWSGVKGQIDQLEIVQKTLEKNIKQVDVKTDKKRFSPYFMLGRIKTSVDSNILRNIIHNFQEYESESCMIKSMVFFKSDRKPSGAVHTQLFEAEFTGMV